MYKLDAPSLAQKAQETLFLATENGDLVGCAFAKVRPGCVYVGKFAIWPVRQGEGIGCRLMKEVEGFAQTTGRSVNPTAQPSSRFTVEKIPLHRPRRQRPHRVANRANMFGRGAAAAADNIDQAFGGEFAQQA